MKVKQLAVIILMVAAPLMGASDKKPAVQAVPAEAKQVEPNTHQYTDAQGKKWIYRKTPFGLVRYEDKPAPAAAKDGEKEQEQELSEAIKAAEDGDSVRFERPGPFGPYRWVRKKTELTDAERQAWERSRRKQPSEKAKREPQE